jgi:hypothetical protein
MLPGGLLGPAGPHFLLRSGMHLKMQVRRREGVHASGPEWRVCHRSARTRYRADSQPALHGRQDGV